MNEPKTHAHISDTINVGGHHRKSTQSKYKGKIQPNVVAEVKQTPNHDIDRGPITSINAGSSSLSRPKAMHSKVQEERVKQELQMLRDMRRIQREVYSQDCLGSIIDLVEYAGRKHESVLQPAEGMEVDNGAGELKLPDPAHFIDGDTRTMLSGNGEIDKVNSPEGGTGEDCEVMAED